MVSSYCWAARRLEILTRFSGAEEEAFDVSTVVDGTKLQEPYNDVAMLPDGSLPLSDKTGHHIWKFTEGDN